GRIVRNDGALWIPETQVLPLAVQVFHLLLQGLRGCCRIAGQDRASRCIPAAAVGDAEIRIRLRDGAPLLVVALQQARARPTLEDARKLPCQIVDVLDASVRTKATRRREAVSRVTRQEYASLLVSLGDLGRNGPESEIEDLDGEIGDAHGFSR